MMFLKTNEIWYGKYRTPFIEFNGGNEIKSLNVPLISNNWSYIIFKKTKIQHLFYSFFFFFFF